MIRFEKTPVFKSEAKRLAKRYPSFRDDLKSLACSIAENPEQGTQLAGGFRKIRMAITSKRKGKSGGARGITLNCLVNATDGLVTFVKVYDKSETENVSLNEIRKALASLEKPSGTTHNT